jgi:hypothetical protein
VNETSRRRSPFRRAQANLRVAQTETDKEPNNGDCCQASTRCEHDESRGGAGARHSPADTEECTTNNVVTLWLRSRKRKRACKGSFDFALLEDPQEGKRHANCRTHEKEHVKLFE